MRKYVDVVVLCTKEGQLLPKTVYWDKGRSYDIEFVPNVERFQDPKSGRDGLKYTCLISGKSAHLYFDSNKWFVNVD